MSKGGERWQKLGFLYVPLLLCCAVGTAMALQHFQPLQVFGVATGTLVGLSLLWVGVSALWPPYADRKCPGCGSEGLMRLDPKTTVGIRCKDCGWTDKDKSGWLFAEDEGPTEQFVLDERTDR